MPSVFGDFFSWLSVGVPAFVFVITIVVFFHELGHFAVARFFNVTVRVFSVGFGRELIGWTDRKGTRWKISILPLGGYVKFAGDADVSSRPDNSEATKEASAEERAGMLQFKPLYQRALVAVAGPLANFLLAIVVFSALFMITGKPAQPPIIDQVMAGSAAEAAGLQQGDIIHSVNGEEIAAFRDLQMIVGESAGQQLRIMVTRAGQDIVLDATPRAVEIETILGDTETIGRLGITDAIVPVGVFEAVAGGVDQTWFILETTLYYLGQMIIGQASPDQLSGPIGIAKISGDVAALGFLALLDLMALISVSIGLINLFPIPILDGGHLLYYGCEAILGRPLGERAQELGFRFGLAFVLCLMLFATFNDLIRFNPF